jgi:hypothetical protein
MGLSQPLIEIYSPSTDRALPADTPFLLEYAILRSTDGHHVKIRVDKRKPQVVVRPDGSKHSRHQIPGLPAGEHRIRITEFTKEGVKTGGDITLKLTMTATAAQPPETPSEDTALK